MKEMKFYICETCKNTVGMIHSSGVPMTCCSKRMTLLEAGTVEASREKHVPVVSIDGDKIKASVGSAMHPMSDEHSIQWICLQTDKGAHLKKLSPSDEPCAEFALYGEKPLAVYAYCNLHGLWKTEI